MKIKSIKKVNNESYRYDLQTITQNFYANDILVHNSMIRPILVDGYLRLATKMGVTEVSMQAEEWLARQEPNKKQWLHYCVELGVTPLFEWISPENQIVLTYDEPDLIFLGVRDNVSGEYQRMKHLDIPFNAVKTYGSVEGNLSEYIARQRQHEGREGDIIRFNDGHMVKVKNDWYVRIHKAFDRVRFDRNIVDLILNEELDDVVPMMPEREVTRIRDFEALFWERFKEKEEKLNLLFLDAMTKTNGDRKKIALEFVPTLEHKSDASFIFKMLDGHNVRELLLNNTEKNISTNTKWDAYAKWMGM